MKFKTLIILALSLVLLVTLALPVSAAGPTEKIKYSHRSDCSVSSSINSPPVLASSANWCTVPSASTV